MATLAIHDRTGAEVGKYEIDPAQIAPRISKQLMHDAVVMYQTNLRQGTARTKNRTDVTGTTKKMYRQKGTGNARAGSRRSGIRRGGGHIHAIRPRDWTYRLTKKALQLATRMALASRIADNEVTLIDQLSFAQPKTQDAAAILAALKLDGASLLVAVPGYDANIYKSIRNIADVSVLPVSELNALNVLQPRRLLLTKSALDAIRDKASAEKPAAKSETKTEN
jgi:large subunit ribosomal protein L4